MGEGRGFWDKMFSMGRKDEYEKPEYSSTGQPLNEAARQKDLHEVDPKYRVEHTRDVPAKDLVDRSEAAAPADLVLYNSPENPTKIEAAPVVKVTGGEVPEIPPKPIDVPRPAEVPVIIPEEVTLAPKPEAPVQKKANGEEVITLVPDESGVYEYGPTDFIPRPDININPHNQLERGSDYIGAARQITQGGENAVVLHTPEDVIPYQKTVRPTPTPTPTPTPVPPVFEIPNHMPIGPERQLTMGEVPEPPKKQERLIMADITAIVDRYARTEAEKKAKEHLDKCRWYNKWFVRQAEAGYVEKYYNEIRDEILNNRNLLTQLELKLKAFGSGKSEAKAQTADQQDRHDEVIEKILEAYDKELVDRSEVKGEIKNNLVVNQRTAELIVDYALGRFATRADFDRAVEDRLVPALSGPGLGSDTERKMYASNMLQMAERYKADVEAKVAEMTQRFGPEAERHVREYFGKMLQIDVLLGEKQADLYQKFPEKMPWYEKFVDMTQQGFLQNSKLGRGLAKIVANPVTYAAVSGMMTRGILRTAGVVAAGVTIGSGTALLVGGAVGAGLYIGARRAREARRDIRRREQEKVLGKRDEKETHDVKSAELYLEHLRLMRAKEGPLTEAEKKEIGEIQARLDLERRVGVDLIGVSKEEGERHGTKFVVETNIRAELKALLAERAAEYGADDVAQGRAMRRYIGDAERTLDPEVRKVNEDTESRIKKERNKAFVNGTLISIAAGSLGPLAAKGIKALSNTIFGTHFNLKTTYIEEVWRQKVMGKSGTELYNGPLADQAPGFMRGHTEIKLPPGFSVREITDPATGAKFIGVEDASHKLVSGVDRIPVLPDGTTPPGSFKPLEAYGWKVNEVPGTPGSKTGTLAEFMDRIRGHLHNGKVEQIHTKGFYDNDTPMRLDAATGRLTGAELNELRLYIKNDGTNIDFNASRLLDNGSFHGALKPNVDRLLANGDIKVAIIPDASDQHSAILLNVDPVTKHAIIPANTPGIEQIIDSSGRIKAGIVGLVDTSDSKGVMWLNAVRAGGKLDFGAIAGPGTPGIVEAVNPVPRPMEGPWTLAGYPRAKETAMREPGKKPPVENPPGSPQGPEGHRTTEGGRDNPENGRRHELPADVKEEFSRDPLAFLANNKWDSMAESRGMQGMDIVLGLYEANNVDLGNGLERIQNGEESVKKNLMRELVDKMAERDPELKKKWKETNPERFKEWALDHALADIKPQLEAKSLAREQLDEVAEKWDVPSVDLITKALESRQIKYQKKESEILKVAKKNGFDLPLDSVRWQILKGLPEQQPAPAPESEPEAPKKKNRAEEPEPAPEDDEEQEEGKDTEVTYEDMKTEFERNHKKVKVLFEDELQDPEVTHPDDQEQIFGNIADALEGLDEEPSKRLLIKVSADEDTKPRLRSEKARSILTIPYNISAKKLQKFLDRELESKAT